MPTTTPVSASTAQPAGFTSPTPFAQGYDHAASPAQRATATFEDDEEEIVWPVSSQSSVASVSPVLVDDTQDSDSDSSVGSTIIPFREDINNEPNNNNNNMQAPGKDNGHATANPFLDDFVLERGDCGSKIWTPPPSVQRPRRRGHRSTKSESALPAPPLLYGSEATLEPVKEAWADDMKGLERQMARASLAAPPTRPRSTPGTEASQTLQSPASSPRKQRGQKKQRGDRSSTGAPAPAASSIPKDTSAAAHSYPSPAPSPSPDRWSPSGMAAVSNSSKPSKKKAKKGKGKNKSKKVLALETAPSTAPSTPRGLGTRSIVDDISENGDALLPLQSASIYQTETDRLLGVAYDEAVKFMNAFIQHPDYYTSRASRLTFLQALTVELGLVSATGPERALPESLTAAKALLKANAFLNVKDYLAMREKGLDALRSAMRPSRSALVRELRGRGGRRAKLGWVKETGLNVLLVSCQY